MLVVYVTVMKVKHLQYSFFNYLLSIYFYFNVVYFLLFSTLGEEDDAQDPFVTISYGNQEIETGVNINGGLTPTWNEAFLFNISGPSTDTVNIQIWDQDFEGKDLICQRKFSLEDLLCRGSDPEFSDMYVLYIYIKTNFNSKFYNQSISSYSH